MTDPRKQKIRDLKAKILLLQDQMVETIKSAKFSGDEKEIEERGNFNNKMAEMRAELSEAQAELKQVRMNKRGSSFFEFIPTPGANRQQRRQMRKLRRL